MERRGRTRREVLRGTATVAGVALGASTAGAVNGGDRGGEGDRGFRAGAARVECSPLPRHLEEGVYLGGYAPGPTRRCDGIHDPMTARSIAVTAGGETAVLTMHDLVGIGNRQLDAVRRRAAARTDLDERAFVIGVSQSHTTPDFQGLWGGVPESYREYLIERTVESIVSALEDRRPTRAEVAQTDTGDSLVTNRRDVSNVANPLTTLRFVDGGETVATLVNFGSSTTIAPSDSTRVSTDWVGPMEEAVEAALGGTCVYFNGQKDNSPSDGEDESFAEARSFGREVARTAVATARDSAEPLPGGVTRGRTSVRLPVDNCVFKGAFESGATRPYYRTETATGTGESTLVRAVEGASETAADAVRAVTDETPNAGVLAIHTPVTRVSLGGGTVELLTVPGEPTTRLARDLRALTGGDYALPLAVTENTLGYLIPRDAFSEGYYDNHEEVFSLGPDAAPLLENGVKDLYGIEGERYERTRDPEDVCPGVRSQPSEGFEGL